MAKYFGTDGFRGVAGETITAEQAFKVGRFLGWYYSVKGGRCKILIGKDTRLSSYMLEYAIAAGITASGGDAYIMHVTTTPSISFITRCDCFDCGVMISASHNSFEDNGIKLISSRGEKLERGVLNLIEDYLEGKLYISGSPVNIPFAKGGRVGKTVDYVAGRNRYVGHLLSLSTCSYKGLKVGIDCANGAGYKIGKTLFEALGATVYQLGGEPNGINVNDGCGSTNPQALKKLVTDNALDIAFAFDGDADRCICVDERGNIIDGDGILFLAARYLKGKGELLGDRIVATVMSNGGLKKSLKSEGITVEECNVGDNFVYEKMCSCGAVLGGEQSGHIIFSKLETTGDGLVTAIMVMEALIERGAPASELLRGFNKTPQLTVSVRVHNKREAVKCPEVLAAISRAERELAKRGKLLVRVSGTEEVIRITAEANTPEECERVCSEIENALKKCGGV